MQQEELSTHTHTHHLRWMVSIFTCGNLKLSSQQTHATGSLDTFLSFLGEMLGLDDDWLNGQMTTSQQFVVTLREKNKQKISYD